MSMFEGFADTPDARLWYWDTGGVGEAVVLCHPASQSCQIWEHQRPVFVAAGYRVIAYSRRGHYRSEMGSSLSGGTTVGDLSNLFDHLGLRQAHVLGAAAGGITATGFAVSFPDRVRSLILAGTIVAPAENDWRALYDRLGIAGLRGIVPTEFLELGPTYRATNPDGTRRFSELGEEATSRGPSKQPIGADVRWATLEAMPVRTLLLTGEADLYAPPPLQALVATHIPNHHLATIPQCGHAPYWETPDTFNALVLDFLAGAKG